RGAGGVAPRRDAHPGGDPRPQPDAARGDLRALVRRRPADQQGDPGRDLPDFQADRLQEVRGPGRGRMSRREVMTQPETDMRATALWTVLLLPLLLLLSACSGGSDHQEPQVEAPSPPISARGNP